MEIYCAYANHLYMMSLLERVTAHATMHALGTTEVRHRGMQIDFGAPFARITCAQALGKLLIAPTFVVDSPALAAPGARRKNDDPTLAEHFTLFAGGEPIAEGLSLLNDPEAHASCDADFIRALEYGMPPTSGARLDIDRWMAVLAGESDARVC
jgi:lysyl-tRNA synthetase class II